MHNVNIPKSLHGNWVHLGYSTGTAPGLHKEHVLATTKNFLKLNLLKQICMKHAENRALTLSRFSKEYDEYTTYSDRQHDHDGNGEGCRVLSSRWTTAENIGAPNRTYPPRIQHSELVCLPKVSCFACII